MKEEVKILLTSIMFYTRIPIPWKFEFDEIYINQASRYLPLVGWLVGGISFLTFVLSAYLLDTPLAIALSLLVGVLVTGAFHEDGLSDMLDGFGGGWTKARILEIMKDSRIGNYGAIALIFLFLIKFYALLNLFSSITLKLENLFLIFLIFCSYHALARLTAINISFFANYSRDDASSKVKPIAKKSGYKEILGAYIFGLLPLCVLCSFHWQFAGVIVPLGIVFIYLKYYFVKWIDGYTGDCLGAAEQIAEVVCLLSFVAIWKFI